MSEKTLDMGMFNSDKFASKKSSGVPAVDLENNVGKRKEALVEFDDYCKKLREAYDRKHGEFLWYVSTINHIREQLQLLTETHHNFKLPNRQKLFEVIDGLLKDRNNLPDVKRKRLEELKDKQRQMILETEDDLKKSIKRLDLLNPSSKFDFETVKYTPQKNSTYAGGGSPVAAPTTKKTSRSLPENRQVTVPVPIRAKSLNGSTNRPAVAPAAFAPVDVAAFAPVDVAVAPAAFTPVDVAVAPVTKKNFQKAKSLPVTFTRQGPGAFTVPMKPRSFPGATSHGRMDNLFGKLDRYINLCGDYEEKYEKKHAEIKELFEMLKKINEMIQSLNSNIYDDVKGDISKYSELLKIVTGLENTEKIKSGLTKQIREQNKYLKQARTVTQDLLSEAKKFKRNPSMYVPPTHHSTLVSSPEFTEMDPQKQQRQHINFTQIGVNENGNMYNPNFIPANPSGQGEYLDVGNTGATAPGKTDNNYLQIGNTGATAPVKPYSNNRLGLSQPPNQSGQGEYLQIGNTGATAPVKPYSNNRLGLSQPPNQNYLQIGNPNSTNQAQALQDPNNLQIGNTGATAPVIPNLNNPFGIAPPPNQNYLQIGNPNSTNQAQALQDPNNPFGSPAEGEQFYMDMTAPAIPYNGQEVTYTTFNAPAENPYNSAKVQSQQSSQYLNVNPLHSEEENLALVLPSRNPNQETGKKLSRTQKKNRSRRKKQKEEKAKSAEYQTEIGTSAGLAEVATKSGFMVKQKQQTKTVNGKKYSRFGGGGRKIGTLKFCCSKNRTKKNSYIGEIMDSNGKRIKLRTKSKRIKELKKLKNKQVTYTEQNGYAVDVREKEAFNNAFPTLNIKTKSKTKRKGPSGTEKINTKKRMRPVGGLPATRK